MSNDHENLSTHSTDHDLTTKPSILTMTMTLSSSLTLALRTDHDLTTKPRELTK